MSPATTLLRDKRMVKGKIKSAAGKRGGWDRSAPQGRQKEARPLAGLRLCCRCHKWDQGDQGTLRSRRAWGTAHYGTALHRPMTTRRCCQQMCGSNVGASGAAPRAALGTSLHSTATIGDPAETALETLSLGSVRPPQAGFWGLIQANHTLNPLPSILIKSYKERA